MASDATLRTGDVLRVTSPHGETMWFVESTAIAVSLDGLSPRDPMSIVNGPHDWVRIARGYTRLRALADFSLPF